MVVVNFDHYRAWSRAAAAMTGAIGIVNEHRLPKFERGPNNIRYGYLKRRGHAAGLFRILGHLEARTGLENTPC